MIQIKIIIKLKQINKTKYLTLLMKHLVKVFNNLII